MFNFRKSKNKENEISYGSNLVSYLKPQSIEAEQYRTLRTNLEFAQIERKIKSIAISSSVPKEGKSTLSSNLAYIYSQTGKKVLLVDADLRKPTVHLTFQLNNENGLTTLLANPELTYEDVILFDEKLNLYILPSGPIPPNPAELIGSTQMSALIETLNKNFDIIIFDTPPIVSVTDAQILATLVDGIILVTRQNYVYIDEIIKAKSAIENVKANLLGFVMTGLEKENHPRYYNAYTEKK